MEGTQFKIWVHLFEIGSPNEIGKSAVTILATDDVHDLCKAIRKEFENNKLKNHDATELVVKPRANGSPLDLDTKLFLVQFERDSNDARRVYVEVPSRPRTGWKLAVRRWIGNDISVHDFDMPKDYDAFRRLLFRYFSFPPTAKVYYFPDDDIHNIAHRVLVDDVSSFNTFRGFQQETPLLYLWTQDQTKSPEVVLAGEPEKSICGSGMSRGSAQTGWAEDIKALDNDRCVVCNTFCDGMVGAHLVPVKTSKAQFQEGLHLMNAHDPKNGVAMCPSCAVEFDAGNFYFDLDGTLHYAESFLETHPQWATRTKVNLKRKPCFMPTEPIIEFRKAYFEEHQKKKRKKKKKKRKNQNDAKSVSERDEQRMLFDEGKK